MKIERLIRSLERIRAQRGNVEVATLHQMKSALDIKGPPEDPECAVSFPIEAIAASLGAEGHPDVVYLTSNAVMQVIANRGHERGIKFTDGRKKEGKG